MKNIVRAFVAVLVLTGSVAYTQVSSSTPRADAILAKVNTMPVPSCPPSDPNACGMGSRALRLQSAR